jgi:hypothetical protein
MDMSIVARSSHHARVSHDLYLCQIAQMFVFREKAQLYEFSFVDVQANRTKITEPSRLFWRSLWLELGDRIEICVCYR